MPNHPIDLVGKRFGKLTVISYLGKPGFRWLCKCDCGKEHSPRGSHLRGGQVQSCGCYAFEHNLKHGNAKRSFKNKATRTYQSWLSMRARCGNPNNPRFSLYGGRGVTICDRWQSFEIFLADMGECPPELTIDRKDPNGNYDPLNCRWATNTTQARNRRGKTHGTSKYKGVCRLTRSTTTFQARIRVGKILHHLGYFQDEWAAAEAYNEAASEYFGEDAYLNINDQK